VLHGIWSLLGGNPTFTAVTSNTANSLRAVARCSGGSVCTNGDIVIAVGLSGTVLRSLDRGVTWSVISSLPVGLAGNVNVTFNAVVNVPGTDTMYLGGIVPVGSAPLLRSTDGGQSWTAVSSPSFAGYRVAALAAFNTTDLWIAGDTTAAINAAIVSKLVGTTRTDQTVPGDAQVRGLAAKSATEIAGVGQGSFVMRTLNGGTTAWTDQAAGFVITINKVHIPRSAAFSSALWATGGSGVVLRSINGGVAWAQQGAAVTFQGLNSIHMLDTGGGTAGAAGFAVGNNGTIIVTQTGGTTWSVHSDSAITANGLYDIDCRSLTACLAVGAAQTVLVGSGALPMSFMVNVSGGAETYRGVSTYLVGGTTPRAIIVGSNGVVRTLNNTTWANQTPVAGVNFTDVTAKSDASGIAVASATRAASSSRSTTACRGRRRLRPRESTCSSPVSSTRRAPRIGT